MSQNTTLFLQICISAGKSPNRIKEKGQTSANGAPWDTSQRSGRLGSTEQGTGKQRGAEEGQAAKVSCKTTCLLWTQRATSSPASPIHFPIPEPRKLQEQELLASGQRGLLCSPGWVFKHHMEALPLMKQALIL